MIPIAKCPRLCLNLKVQKAIDWIWTNQQSTSKAKHIAQAHQSNKKIEITTLVEVVAIYCDGLHQLA